MESFGISFARRESFNDGTLGIGFELGVAAEKEVRRIRRWGRSEGADGVDAQSWFIEERLKGRMACLNVEVVTVLRCIGAPLG